ncbi:MAG: hypothetical protein L7S67_00120, partial [Flavobacteriales bacterium]|nr:hypothetical protein [Flavobacteriales bacterium]
LSLWFTYEEESADSTVLLTGASDFLRADFVNDSLQITMGENQMRMEPFDHNWNHLILIHDEKDNSVEVFLNGRLQDFMLLDTTTTHGLFPMSIGMEENGVKWTGMLDDIAVWERALTYGEASSLHMTEGARFKVEPLPNNDNRSTISFTVYDIHEAYSSPLDGELAFQERNVLSVTHNAIEDLGCIDRQAANFRLLSLEDSNPDMPSPEDYAALYCAYDSASSEIWVPNYDRERLQEAININLDSDKDGVPDSEELNGCSDPEACNYYADATDNYANYTFLDYLHISASDSARFYVSRDTVSWDQAVADAATLGGHIATLSSLEEAFTIAERTSFTTLIATDVAQSIVIGGHTFVLFGEADSSRYYRSTTDTLNLHDWQHHSGIRWEQIVPNLLTVDDAAENAALVELMIEEEVDKIWINANDEEWVGIGEGNWTSMKDGTPMPYDNFQVNLTELNPNFITKWEINDNLYDFAQLWATSADSAFGTHATTTNHSVSSGDWVPMMRTGAVQKWVAEGEFNIHDTSAAHLILEMPLTFCAPGFNFAVADSNGFASASALCPTKEQARLTLIEIPLGTTDCAYVDPEVPCEDCLYSRNSLDKLPISFVGRTDSSKYFISTNTVTMEDLISERDYDFSQLTEHMVRIDTEEENQQIVSLLSQADFANVEQVWLGVTDSLQDGTWRHLRDDSPVNFTNWHADETFDNRNDSLIFGHRYGQYDYAQLWLTRGDRRWHDANSNEIIPEAPLPGDWIAMPSYGVIYSGAFPAHALFEFPLTDLEILAGYDNNGNEICDHREKLECLDVFSDVALASSDGALAMAFNGYDEFDPELIYLLGFGTYTLFGVPVETPVTITADHMEFITITGDSSSAQVVQGLNGEDTYYFHGDVEILVSGDFGSGGLNSIAEGDMLTNRRFQFHLPSPENSCTGICLSDDNFNNVCDEYEGCMEPTACNYNPTATYDDNSCVDAWHCTGCRDTLACNYNINATKDGVEGEFYVEGSPLGYIPYAPSALGAADYDIPVFCLYTDPVSECEYCSGDVDGSGIVLGGDTLINGAVWCVDEIGCTDPSACDYNALADPLNPYALSDCALYAA